MEPLNMNIFIKKEEVILNILDSLKKKVIMSEKLPNKFIPASNDFFKEQFYWDSFFIISGLDVNDLENQKLILGIVENFFFMIEKYGYIPNSFDSYDTRSQPPFLSAMILIVYDIFKDKIWLKKAYSYLVKEYEDFWMKKRMTYTGLNRYYDDIHPNGLSINAEDESGWDLNPRFKNRADMAIPIDLNSLLYKYEIDLSSISEILGYSQEIDYFKNKAEIRKNLIFQYLWSDEDKIFYDYDLELEEHFGRKSLAIYYPMFVGMVDSDVAQELYNKLHLFDQDYGLSVCDQDYNDSYKQWNYPNGWAPLHYIVYNSLKDYGFVKKANQIAYKWISLNFNSFMKTGFWEEKFCVVKGLEKTDDSRYEHQTELYWTLGIFCYLFRELKNQII